jgi:hypothetical protein
MGTRFHAGIQKSIQEFGFGYFGYFSPDSFRKHVRECASPLKEWDSLAGDPKISGTNEIGGKHGDEARRIVE